MAGDQLEQTVFTGADLQAQVAAAFGLDGDEAEDGEVKLSSTPTPKGLGLGASLAAAKTLESRREEAKETEKLKRKLVKVDAKDDGIRTEELSTWGAGMSDDEEEELGRFAPRKRARVPLANQLLEEARKSAKAVVAGGDVVKEEKQKKKQAEEKQKKQRKKQKKKKNRKKKGNL